MMVVVFLFLGYVFFFYEWDYLESRLWGPPLYERYHATEDELPQHNMESSFLEGKDIKYLCVSNQAQGVYHY